MKTFNYFVLVVLISMSSCLRQVNESEDFYDNGVLKYKSKTTTYGAETDFEINTKFVSEITAYYENGKIELKQKIVERPAYHSVNPATMEPVNMMPNKTRTYYKYNRNGDLVEEGKEKKGKSKTILYNVDTYKRIITKKNQDWRVPKIKYIDKYPARAPINLPKNPGQEVIKKEKRKK